MIKDENEEKIPLLEMLDEAIRKAIKDVKMEDRTVNQAQYKVLQRVYESISHLIDGEVRINIYPSFTSGGITIVAKSISLSDDKLSTLRENLSECTAVSVEPLVNGNIELSVTIPDVFYPIDHNPTE